MHKIYTAVGLCVCLQGCFMDGYRPRVIREDAGLPDVTPPPLDESSVADEASLPDATLEPFMPDASTAVAEAGPPDIAHAFDCDGGRCEATYVCGERCEPPSCEPQDLCAASCLGGGDVCGSNCPVNKRCLHECTWVGRCETICLAGSMCDVDCTQAGHCSVICQRGATCLVHCRDPEECELLCDPEATCEKL